MLGTGTEPAAPGEQIDFTAPGAVESLVTQGQIPRNFHQTGNTIRFDLPPRGTKIGDSAHLDATGKRVIVSPNGDVVGFLSEHEVPTDIGKTIQEAASRATSQLHAES